MALTPGRFDKLSDLPPTAGWTHTEAQAQMLERRAGHHDPAGALPGPPGTTHRPNTTTGAL